MCAHGPRVHPDASTRGPARQRRRWQLAACPAAGGCVCGTQKHRCGNRGPGKRRGLTDTCALAGCAHEPPRGRRTACGDAPRESWLGRRALPRVGDAAGPEPRPARPTPQRGQPVGEAPAATHARTRPRPVGGRGRGPRSICPRDGLSVTRPGSPGSSSAVGFPSSFEAEPPSVASDAGFRSPARLGMDEEFAPARGGHGGAALGVGGLVSRRS